MVDVITKAVRKTVDFCHAEGIQLGDRGYIWRKAVVWGKLIEDPTEDKIAAMIISEISPAEDPTPAEIDKICHFFFYDLV